MAHVKKSETEKEEKRVLKARRGRRVLQARAGIKWSESIEIKDQEQ